MSLKRYQHYADLPYMLEVDDGMYVKYRDFEKLIEIFTEHVDCDCCPVSETEYYDCESCKEAIETLFFGGEDE